MSLSIAGKTAIVTGAANGIGLAIARHFLAKGANVMLVDTHEAQLEEALGGASHDEGTTRIYAGDLRDKLTIANLVSATVDAFDRVDILVNARRKWALSDALDPEHDEVESLWAENLIPALRLSQMVARRMIQHTKKTGGEGQIGTIINLSSLASQRAHPQLLAYSITCAAIEQMTRTLALELSAHGIRVNALSFGSVMSESLQAALKETPEWREGILQATPQKRIATADELAEAAHFLASDASGFMTGQTLTLDGGRSLLDAAFSPGF